MATAFAITGIHRSRLKHYRPSYQSELPPIYEDARLGRHSTHDANRCINPCNDDYMYVPSFIQNDRKGENTGLFVHDYEEIDADRLSQVSACKLGTLSKPSNPMLHGIMSNRMQVKSKPVDSDIETECVGNNEDKTEMLAKTAEVSTLRRASSVYQGCALAKDGGNGMKTTADATGEVFSNGSSTKKWPKLVPEPLKLPNYLCPAEKKIKRRCFAVCFVILVLVIGTFIVVSLDGWIYSAKGHGLAGAKKPILFKASFPDIVGDNITDVHDSNT